MVAIIQPGGAGEGYRLDNAMRETDGAAEEGISASAPMDDPILLLLVDPAMSLEMR